MPTTPTPATCASARSGSRSETPRWTGSITRSSMASGSGSKWAPPGALPGCEALAANSPCCAARLRAAGERALGEPGGARPLRGPARGQADGARRGCGGTALGARRGAGAGELSRMAHGQALRFDRRRALRAAADRVWRRNRCGRDQGRGDAGPLLSELPRRARRAGRLRALPRARAGDGRPTGRRGGRGPAARARLPARSHQSAPGGGAAGDAGPRIGRPCGRAGPGARARDLLRGHELHRAGRAGLPAARLGARERDRRRGNGRRPRQLPLGRRGRGGTAAADRPRRGAERVPELAGDGRGDGAPALRGLHARRELRPPADRAHDKREPRPRRGGHARAAGGGHRPRRADRHQPLLVDRLAPAAVPVRGRGRLGDRRRRAQAAAAQPELRGRDAGVLGALRRRLLPCRVAAGVAHRLRQGRARAGRARVPRVGAGALPGRGSRSGVNALEAAERALGAAGASDRPFATATRERSLLLRFAASRPTQATAVDDLAVELAVLRDGHVGRASTNDVRDDAFSAAASNARVAADAAARAVGPGPYPGFPAPMPGPAHAGHDANTARLDPARGRAELEAAFGAAAGAGVEAHGIWTAAEVETAVASEWGVAFDLVTDAFMKVICIAPSGRSGYASATAVRAGALDGGSLAGRAAAKATAEGEPERLDPGDHPVVMEPQALGLLLELLGATAFNGLAHAEGRGALAGRLGTAVAAPSINLSDSPRFPRTLPRAFDAEGVPKAPLPLIQDGVAQGVVHDVNSAALAGASSTGHALAAGGSASGPLPTNLVLAGGGADEAELCAPIERG